MTAVARAVAPGRSKKIMCIGVLDACDRSDGEKPRTSMRAAAACRIGDHGAWESGRAVSISPAAAPARNKRRERIRIQILIFWLCGAIKAVWFVCHGRRADGRCPSRVAYSFGLRGLHLLGRSRQLDKNIFQALVAARGAFLQLARTARGDSPPLMDDCHGVADGFRDLQNVRREEDGGTLYGPFLAALLTQAAAFNHLLLILVLRRTTGR
jgi:hypothetical protein